MAESSITLYGNLTRDPDLAFTTGGKGKASFGIACNRRWQQGGEWQEQTSFFNVSCWDKLAENTVASLHKGDRIIVVGRLEQRQYETKEGEKRNVVEIVAEEIGASVRWTTLEIDRTEREGRQDRTTRQGSRPADPVYGDEEPF